MIKVRSHYRISKKGKKSVVRKHTRILKDLKKDLSEKAKKNTTVVTKHSAKGTSLAHTDTHLKKGSNKPIKHVVKVDAKKSKEAGQSIEQVLAHEFGHILDRDRVTVKNIKSTLSRSDKAKPLMTAIKKSSAYKKLKGNEYATAPEELFARAYSQYKTGKGHDISKGLGWTTKDFSLIKKEMGKLLMRTKQ